MTRLTRLTRRQTLAATAALPAAALPLSARAQSAGAQSDAEGAMRPGAHRTFELGGRRLTTLLVESRPSDGDPQETFGMDVPPETFAEVSRENFISPDAFRTFFNPVLVQDGERTILFDTGLGGGALDAALEGAGAAPGDVTHVVITHMHPDHVGGLMRDGSPAFPEAEHVAGRVEFEWWTANPAPHIEENVLPIADRFTLVEDGAEIAPGVTAMAAFGHTPGHMTFRVDGEAGPMLITGDLANHHVWSLGHPDWDVRFDMDHAEAAQARRRVLGMLASERMPMTGYHMPFPAAGFVETRDDGFHWVPTSYQFMS